MSNTETQRRSKPRRSLWRRTSSWCVRLAVLGVLALGYVFFHLNQIGLPDVIKNPLLAELRGRGLNLDFARLRLRLTRGIVAEKVRLIREGQDTGEQFQVGQIQLKLNYPALFQRRLEILALRIRDGDLTIPVGLPDQGGTSLKIENVQTTLRFADTNHWVLETLEGQVHGARLQAHGTLTNVLAFRRPPTATVATNRGSWKQPVARWIRLFDRMQFSQPPKLDIDFLVDAADPAGGWARLELTAGGAETEFGKLGQMELKATAAASQDPAANATNRLLHVDVTLRANGASTRWAGASELTLEAKAEQLLTNQPPQRIQWKLTATQLTNQWGNVGVVRAEGQTVGTGTDTTASGPLRTSLQTRIETITAEKGRLALLTVSGQVTHSWTNWVQATADLRAESPSTDWGDAGEVQIHASAHPVTDVEAHPEWGPWNTLRRVQLQCEVGVQHVVTPKLQVDTATVVLGWQAPRLELISLRTALHGGEGEASGSLDVASRRAQVRVRQNVNLHALSALLTPAANQWLGQYSWKGAPPNATAVLGVTLPAWTNRHPDWRREVLPTLTLSGNFDASQVAFRGVPAGDAAGEFALTNASWNIPRVTLRRPEGAVEFAYHGDMFTHDYHFRLRSTIDPTIARQLLDDDRQKRAFDHFSLSTPPLIEGDVWGRWMERERTGFLVKVTATNAVIRGEACDFADGTVGFTNGVLTFKDVTLHQGAGRAFIPGAAYDVPQYLLSFTNAVSTLSPASVTRVIGARTAALLEPYQFAEPPHAVVNGVIGTKADVASKVQFEIDGGRFQWLRLHAETAKGVVHWVGQTLLISNLVAGCYGGNLQGDLNFDMAPDHGSVFNFGLAITNIDLRRLMADVGNKTNRLEGMLSGVLNLDHARSSDTNSWDGHGHLTLREGFLWDTPAFGVFSPIFEGISPGLGQTRFSSGSAHFIATNSVLRTEDLEVRSSTVRLKYTGTVGLDSRLDARMEAELLKDLPVLGPMLSAALTPFTKLFEYRVRGTLSNPVAEPLYVPKLLLVPLHPIRSIREFFSPSDKKPGQIQNAPTEATPPK